MNQLPSLHVPADPSLSNGLPKSGQVRRVGWALIVFGPCISIAMACAARALYGATVVDRLTGRPSRSHGSPEFTRMTAELLGAVFLLGAVIFLGGVYQVRTGRRSCVLVVLTLGLAAVTAYLVCGVASSR